MVNHNIKKENLRKKKGIVIEENLLKQFPLQQLNFYAFKDGISLIGAFNIQAFGLKKLENDDIIKIIIHILRRYNIVLCQEVHFNEKMIEKLVNMPGHAFGKIKALVTDIYAYVKEKSVKRSGLSHLLSLLCLNTKEVTIFRENCGHIILMGDFNASGSYLKETKQEELDEILIQNNLMWVISHSCDTTVASNRTAYDRFIFEIKNKNRLIEDARILEFDKF
ncbi:30144_t:CDS:2 [Racocetra persica]|uniref:30144_t:CDS:1 n=1 Tax=Racocetra persica TaxID=160502 RepID=A0ACA9L2V6_9GLOM|nr:30144_t:CDS:2 [Racocetra persica]